jgi:hypothetical protein
MYFCGVWGVKGGGQECPRDWTLEQFVMWVKRVEHNFDPPPARWDIRDDPSARELVEEWERKQRERNAMAIDFAA